LLPATDPKLAGDQVLVAAAGRLRVVEVEEDDVARLAPTALLDLERHAVGQVLVDELVAGQADGFDVLELENDAGRLVVGHPGVEARQGAAESALQQHRGLAVPLSCQYLAWDVGVAELAEQFQGRLLGLVSL